MKCMTWLGQMLSEHLARKNTEGGKVETEP